MNAHTPGKWGFDDEWVFSDSHLAGKGDIVCLNPAMEGFEHSAKRWEANARLISAAPDLLNFAIAFVDLFNGDPRSPLDKSLLEQARAAIAKAMGEQP